ncbi:hypothetical protein LNP04_11880 [Chryseobacterium sp. C-71]|uniref:hypothetical protein n=1 Tax=Chryseobacterium sp. C-71 TaxID=2893882 RepID=UPI001E2EB2AB|nr:hypothetical protein [Chryseobacterium sp. C-71]UFH30673.1 hypothetical protein LNP04_11880 [Chryseobacterium sp. C-71]
MPNFKIQASEISENSFVLEKEEDVAKIGKDYIIYIQRNSGSRKMNKVCDCTELEEKYILFKVNNTSYIQKIAGKAVYYPKKLKSNDIIDLYVDSFSNLKNERVKKFRTMQRDNIFAFHRTFKQYILIVEQDKPITINFYEEDFQKEGFGEKNVNYPYNKNLLFYKIDRLLNSEIDKLNKRDAFVFRTCRKD